MSTPLRVKLSRAKGWRMPPNTIKVDRSTRWGNPFVVGVDGTRERCVQLFEYLLGGYLCVSRGDPKAQDDYRNMVARDRHLLKGKNLACWCPLDKPCHADVLLRAAATAPA
jgi:hypothetical protein